MNLSSILSNTYQFHPGLRFSDIPICNKFFKPLEKVRTAELSKIFGFQSFNPTLFNSLIVHLLFYNRETR